MSVRISAIFQNVDAADCAVRNLGDIHIYKRRTSRTSDRKISESVGVSTPSFYETDYAISSIGFSGVSHGFEQGGFIPTLFEAHTEPCDNEDVQLEVWVDVLDANETIDVFINSHGAGVRSY